MDIPKKAEKKQFNRSWCAHLLFILLSPNLYLNRDWKGDAHQVSNVIFCNRSLTSSFMRSRVAGVFQKASAGVLIDYALEYFKRQFKEIDLWQNPGSQIPSRQENGRIFSRESAPPKRRHQYQIYLIIVRTGSTRHTLKYQHKPNVIRYLTKASYIKENKTNRKNNLETRLCTKRKLQDNCD